MADNINSSSVLIPYVENGARSTGTHLVQPPAPPPQAPIQSSMQQLSPHNSLHSSSEDDPFAGCERYKKYKFIGAGASGQVYVAWDSALKEYVAIKFLESSRVSDKYLKREVLNHRELRHPHIICFKEVLLTQRHIGIAMEWAAGGTLADYLKRSGTPGLSEDLARWIFQQIVFGLDYSHRKGIANRDLKLDNTLLDWMDSQPLPIVKLCDFGYSKSDFQSAASSRVGSLFYMAPEVITNLTGTYNPKKADVWSCGVILYRMLFNKWPFVASTMKDTMDKIVRLQYDIPDHPPVSASCKQLLKCMLAPLELRADLASIQAHPWYMHKLLPGVQGLNDHFLAQDLSGELQPIEEIEKLLQHATQPQPTDLDEYDRLIDQTTYQELHNPESMSLNMSYREL